MGAWNDMMGQFLTELVQTFPEEPAIKKYMTSFSTSSFRRASVPFLVPSSVVVVVISREVVVFLVVFVGCHVLLDGGRGSGFFHLFEHRFPLFLVF